MADKPVRKMKGGGILKEFRAFIDRGNLIQLAVAFILGVAFSSVVNSLVKDIIMPAVGLATGGVDFSNLFVVIKNGNPTGGYATLQAAQDAGAVTINYGLFVNAIITFLIVAIVLFFVVKAYSKVSRPKAATTKACPFCASTIPLAAIRCPQCTSELPADVKP
jgi:large conductance mechanosensitive channel